MVKPISRKPWRKKAKETEKDLKKKIGLFNKMGDECLTCQEFFDKTDVEMVSTWHVVVRKEDEEVRLYCPDCWYKATKIISDFKAKVEERENVDS